MSHPTESQIQRAITETLVMDGWLVIRLNAGGMVQDDGDYRRYVRFSMWQALGFEESDKGQSDLIASKGGKVLFIEVKRPGGKQRKSQKIFEDAVQSTGGIYVLADDVEALRPYLERVEL